MRTVLIACAAALLLARPAGAVSETQHPYDAHGRPIHPGGPQDRPPLAETPTREAAPQREALQEELRLELEDWRDRVDAWRREHEAFGGEPEAARLVEALEVAEQSWRRLAQSTGPSWEQSMHHMRAARQDLERAWDEANR